jgi:glycosyltransferase involved in cell wall biosynthesis
MDYAKVAQLVEHRTENARVAGSSPALGTRSRKATESHAAGVGFGLCIGKRCSALWYTRAGRAQEGGTVAHPTISLILPAYNAERFLAQALASVFAQSRVPNEIIVIDDGSTDGTAAVAAGYGSAVRAVTQENRGPAAARNHGLQLAGGELIAFLDSDDWLPADSLALRAERLMRYPQYAGVFGGTQIMLAGADGLSEPTPWGDVQPTLNFGCTMMRRSTYEAVGGFDETLIHAEDADWLLRAREAGLQFGRIAETVLFARRHGRNLTNQHAVSSVSLLRVLRRSLARRAAGGLPTADLQLSALPECV